MRLTSTRNWARTFSRSVQSMLTLARTVFTSSCAMARSVGSPSTLTAISSHLPRVPIVYELPESERHCACGSTLIEIGTEVSEQLDYLPAKVQVLQHVRKKYACPGCEQCLKTAALPAQILPKTNASPGMAAHVVTSKFVDALPFYRQEVIFERHGVRLPRSTQAEIGRAHV